MDDDERLRRARERDVELAQALLSVLRDRRRLDHHDVVELESLRLARGQHRDRELVECVPVLTPRQAKGLEFDHVVVVEPAAIAEDGEQGLRELYVALTRPTKTLVVVHARPLPEGLAA